MSTLLEKTLTNTDLFSGLVEDFGMFSRVANFLKDSGLARVRPSDDEHAEWT